MWLFLGSIAAFLVLIAAFPRIHQWISRRVFGSDDEDDPHGFWGPRNYDDNDEGSV